MKSMIASMLFVLSFSSFADVPSFTPKTSTCAEIQAAVAQYGSVGINVKYLFGTSTYETFSERVDCGFNQMERKMKVRTSDGVKCFVGYYCDEMITP